MTTVMVPLIRFSRIARGGAYPDPHIARSIELPDDFTLDPRSAHGQPWMTSTRGLRVLVDLTMKGDARPWLHASFSYADHLPTYEDVALVKRVFVGPDLLAIQVFPKQAEHVNEHPYCLHLWACLEDGVLPDFRIAGRI